MDASNLIADAILAYLVSSHVSKKTGQVEEAIHDLESKIAASKRHSSRDGKKEATTTSGPDRGVSEVIRDALATIQLSLEKKEILRRIEVFNQHAAEFDVAPISGPFEKFDFEEDLKKLRDAAWMGTTTVLGLATSYGWIRIGAKKCYVQDDSAPPKSTRNYVYFLRKSDRVIAVATASPDTNTEVKFIKEAKPELFPNPIPSKTEKP